TGFLFEQTTQRIEEVDMNQSSARALFVGLFGLFLTDLASGAVNRWSTSGPQRPVLALAIGKQAGTGGSMPKTVLYAGTASVVGDNRSGVLKSTDGGTTWVKTGFGWDVNALAIDPSTPTTIYAG